MQRKSVLPFAFVLGIAAVWTMLTRGGDDATLPVITLPRASQTQTTTTVTASETRDEAREKHLENILTKKDSVKVHSIVCAGATCTIEASPHSDPAALRSDMQKLLVENPGLGDSMDEQTHHDQGDRMTFVIQRPMPAGVE
ncbi:MAG TPA: hypothetical protein VE954_12155 [Oligoflexus sp.]|uniref:hypothetical protein n=1 Tax=Oligoflexus sp. TaxID=1971216 RepID=UPI002D648B1A|nr:hypothetical protein [Oligoflexus sp.]HYX33859.1 hypothetical protein [Oligoflexus sp.]